MPKSKNESNISETLKVLKKALEDNDYKYIKEPFLLTKIVKSDGTIMDFDKSNIKKELLLDNEITNDEFEKYFGKHIDLWVKKNMNKILNNYKKK